MRNLIPGRSANVAVFATWLCVATGVIQAQTVLESRPATSTDAGHVAQARRPVNVSGRFPIDDSQMRSAVPSGSLSAPGTIRQAQAEAAQPAAPATQPPAVNPELVEPGLPGSNLSDLSLPAAERGFGGGMPTTSAAEGEAAAEAEKKDTRGLLMKALDVPEDAGWRIYGWIQNSFTGNTNGHSNGFNFGVNPNFKANQWMGNQYYLIFENPVEANDEVNWGFRIDNMFGNDWQFNYMQGLFNGAFPPGHFAGYDMPQLYGEVHLPVLTKGGLDVKGGRFYTIAGYEVVPAVGRPLLSVPYMFNYGQPFTHVGVITTLHLTDRLNLYNGAINGWDRWINQRYVWGYIGGFSWTSEDTKTTLAFTCVWGPNQFPSFLPANQPIYPTGYLNIPSVAGLQNPGYARNDRTLFTTVLTHKWTDKLTQVLETDQGWERSVPGAGASEVNFIPINAAAKTANWYSFGNWFLYSFSDKFMGVWRAEVFWDESGVRTGQVDGNTRQARLVGDRYYEMTLGAQIKPYDWLWIRPEARYDWSQYHPSYSNDTRKSQLTLAFDVIFLF